MSQRYIGTPNGVVVCVDSLTEMLFRGRVYHGYKDSEEVFENADQLIFCMQDLFDRINFPHPGTTIRSFRSDEKKVGKNAANNKGHSSIDIKERMKGGPERMMTDKELLSKHGDIGTFIVRVQHRQNSTWQGRITWTEEDKTLNFRSIWEMIHLMESAMSSIDEKAEHVKLQEWE